SIHMAIASSMASILISAIASFATFAGNSIVNPAALGQVDYLVAIAFGIGMVVGAQIGAIVSKKLSSKRLKPMAASMIMVIAILMILKALLNP
ncbi:TSUP family transporter, partial [Candidatus Bathyarchaeota archaeon]|nr:TSUP family transporter [Candidatus Bathyarchaeota archaeon]